MREVFVPKSSTELWDMWGSYPNAQVYAGGTDFLVQLRNRKRDASVIICMERLEAFKGVQQQQNMIRIGACTTLSHVLKEPVIRKHIPVLATAIRRLGSPLIRNMATIGGNICTASPAGDTLPPLYILDAVLEICSEQGIRHIALKDFIHGPGQTALMKNEILSCINVKIPQKYQIHHFEKVGKRKAMTCSVASLAGLLKLDHKGVIKGVRLAWGAVGPRVLMSEKVERSLKGMQLSAESLENAVQQGTEIFSPIDDIRASADYRRKIAGNLMRRLVRHVQPDAGYQIRPDTRIRQPENI